MGNVIILLLVFSAMSAGLAKKPYEAKIVFGTAFVFVFAMLGMWAVNFDGFWQEDTPVANVMGANETLAQNETQNQTNAAETAPPITCTTTWKKCFTGEEVKTVKCSSGSEKVEECPPNPYEARVGEVPSTIRYYGLFKCFWDVKEKYGYGKMFDPFVVCQSQIYGWDEACKCAGEIESYVRTYGKPSLPK